MSHRATSTAAVGADETDPTRPDPRVTFTVDEVAERLGLSRSAAYDCIARGEIPAKRFGRRVVVVRAALEALLAEPDDARRPLAPQLRRLGRSRRSA